MSERDATTPSVPPAPAPLVAPPTTAATRARRRAWRWLAGAVASVLVLVAVVVGVLAWSLHSARGSAWLAGWVPGLTIVAPQGSLIGDFAAERIEIVLPGRAGTLRFDAPSWKALAVERGGNGRWLHLRIARLHADRLTVLPASGPRPASTEPARPPSSLRLPLEIEIDAASVDELRVGAEPDAFALRGLRARVHLGDEAGRTHRFQDLAAAHPRADATGAFSIDADPPFAVSATLRLASPRDAVPAWAGSASAAGPLDALKVDGRVRVTPTSDAAVQTLAARATVRPFAAWPLGELQATTESLDLSVFSAGAPKTALRGVAIVASDGLDRPAAVTVELENARAGRWNEGLLPVKTLHAEVRATPNESGAIALQSLAADLGSAGLDGGRIAGSGRWNAGRWNAELALDGVRPSSLDARAPETVLKGTASANGSGFASAVAADRVVELVADLAGPLVDRRLPKAAPRDATVHVALRARADELELRAAEARLGGAQATLTGRLSRAGSAAPWRAAGQAALRDFDPAPWWPGSANGPLARGPHRLNAHGTFDLVLPAQAGAAPIDLLVATRGRASLSIADSVLAGVPLQGEASFANADGAAAPNLDLLVGGNRVKALGRLAANGARDTWQVTLDAPKLAALAPLFGPPAKGSTAPALGGTLVASGRIDGRWPDVASQGDLQAGALRWHALSVRRAEGRWRLGSAAGAATEATLALDDASFEGRRVEQVQLHVSGTAKAHALSLRIASDALPPPWVDALATARQASGEPPSAAPTAASAATASAAPAGRSVVELRADGGLVDAGATRAAGWSGAVRELAVRSVEAPGRTWLLARELRGSVFWSGGPMRASVEPGSAEALGATARWGRVDWQGADARGAGGRLDATATIDPIPVAPLLRAMQPDFGWGGDLTVGARLQVHGTPAVTVDAVAERASGDLTVTEEFGTTQRLGLTDLRFGIAANDGVWNFTGALAGSTLGVAAGAVVARTDRTATWPRPETPIEGVLELRVANLGTWGPWVPAGWRLAGALHASASFGGRFGAPEYTGHVEGTNLGVRNFLQGVNVHDGDVAIALQGARARIERFEAHAGAGTVRLEGEAAFDAAPVASLRLTADRFEMLGRVDRRIVASGNGAMRLDATTVALDGDFRVDEGLIDFTRSDAPTLGDDVEVVRRPAGAPAPVTAASAAAGPTPAPAAVPAPTARKVALDLRVAMGEQLRIRGRGLDAGLRGALHLTSPNGRLAVDGTLRAVDGTYQAYGQKLGIDRGVLTFAGAIENPRLDIEATRPNLDVRVGVVVAGTALNPRIRLFSEPEMSDIDKLSWLVLGRASEGAGRGETALLQRAALALLSGEGPGVTDRITRAIGLDEISVRRSEGDVKETIVSLGKQISKRWYVGYERGLNATTGSWQLVYRIAQRLTVRAQAGGDNSLDLIWTLRWK